jgi:hypothetical protein
MPAERKDELAAKVWDMVQSLDFPPNIIGLSSTKHWTWSKINGFNKKTLERIIAELQEVSASRTGPSGAKRQDFEAPNHSNTTPSNRELELVADNARLRRLLDEAEERISELTDQREILEENRRLRFKNEELTENYRKALEAYNSLKFRRKE